MESFQGVLISVAPFFKQTLFKKNKWSTYETDDLIFIGSHLNWYF